MGGSATTSERLCSLQAALQLGLCQFGTIMIGPCCVRMKDDCSAASICFHLASVSIQVLEMMQMELQEADEWRHFGNE